MGTSSVGPLILVILLALPLRSHSQAGSVDLSFDAALNSGAQVYVVTHQTNGQLLIGGTFTNVGGIRRTNVARLNPDGTLDATFNPGAAANIGYVSAIAVQPDGKVLIGGQFSSTTFAAPANLARLNSNGTVDAGFDPDLSVDAVVNAVVTQSDGKIVLGGGFTVVDGLTRKSVARLLTNGMLDVGFDACVATGGGNGATALALRNDGKILMSGNFTFSTGTERNGVALLGTNGDLDVTYAPEPGVDSGTIAYTLARRADGKVLLGGNFTSYHTVPRNGLVQLATNSAPDLSFDPGSGINFGATLYTIALQADDKALVGGDFIAFNGETKRGVARINLDGTTDQAFDTGTGPNDVVGSIHLQSDGRILVGGRFSTFNGVTRNGLVRLKGDPGPFRLDAPTLPGNGAVQLTFYGENQAHYAIQVSSNLTNWISFTNLTATNVPMPVIDVETGSRQFYRALLLP